MANKFFDEYGYFIGEFSETCVKDCTLPGQDASENCRFWREELEFIPDRNQAIVYILPFGSWNKEELESMDDKHIAYIVLWLACGEIKESGEWLGMVH